MKTNHRTHFLLYIALIALVACDGETGDKAVSSKKPDADPVDTATDPADTAADPVDADGDGFPEDEDCDDSRADVSPAGTEVCDDANVDEDCDGNADDDDNDVTGTSTWYSDSDGDGYGAGDPSTTCGVPSWAAEEGIDFDDGDPDVWFAPDEAEGDLSEGFETFCRGYSQRSLEGNLDLYRATEADVAALTCLTTVGGDFYFHYNDALTSLSGLEALTTVGVTSTSGTITR